MSVTFETKVWQGDWELVLKTGRLAEIVRRCSDPLIENRVLFINNVDHPAEVGRFADHEVARGTIDSYIFVEEHAAAALEFFQLTKQGLGVGYYYSIAELVAVYLCRTEYLLHFSSDAAPTQSANFDWLREAVGMMRRRPDVAVYNLSWDATFREAASESDAGDANYYYGFGFSDQMYLVRTAEFRQPIYGETNVVSERYPTYGGELFEKRVDAWMRNHARLRATDRCSAYRHKNFPRTSLARRISVALGVTGLD